MDSMILAIMHATLISQLVLILLLCMSLGSWAFMFGKMLQVKKAQKFVTKGLARLDKAKDLKDCLILMEQEKSSPLFGITRRGVKEFNRINKTGDAERLLNDNVRRALDFGIEEEIVQLKSSLAFLATISNTAPFIGLFGTVWGILYSFQSIASMKSVSIATVAPGIAEALIATAVGLFVAIPATCGYNIFRAKVTGIEGKSIIFAGQLLNRFQHEASSHPLGLHFAGEK